MRDVVARLSVGTADFVIKPFRFEELLARVRWHLPFDGVTPSTETGSR